MIPLRLEIMLEQPLVLHALMEALYVLFMFIIMVGHHAHHFQQICKQAFTAVSTASIPLRHLCVKKQNSDILQWIFFICHFQSVVSIDNSSGYTKGRKIDHCPLIILHFMINFNYRTYNDFFYL